MTATALPPLRTFAIVCDVADDEEPPDLVVMGHGMELPDGAVIFVWARDRDGRRAYGEFATAERARRMLDRSWPAELVWCGSD